MKNAYIFAGVNGAGKTTLYYNELEKTKDFGRRINIDEMVSSFGNWKDQKDHIRASKIAINLRNSYIKNSYDFNIDKIKEELADVFIYSLDLANQLNLDVSDIVTSKIEINSKKYPVDKCKGSAKKYNEF